MLSIFGVDNGELVERRKVEPASLVRLVDPSADELKRAMRLFAGVEMDDLKAALDAEEPSRFEAGGSHALLVVDAPVPEKREGLDGYRTYPLGFIVSGDVVATTSLVDFHATLSRGQQSKMTVVEERPRYVYDILMLVAGAYQRYLRNIESRRLELVERVKGRTTTADLMALHGLETDIVYLETALAGNRAALERAVKNSLVSVDYDDERLFDDLLIEMRQAEEMASIYKQLISSTRELFSNIMDNSLNQTMKLLAAITIILAIPTMIAGFYGMNVASEGMPLSQSAFGFAGVICLCVAICIVAALILKRKNLL